MACYRRVSASIDSVWRIASTSIYLQIILILQYVPYRVYFKTKKQASKQASKQTNTQTQNLQYWWFVVCVCVCLEFIGFTTTAPFTLAPSQLSSTIIRVYRRPQRWNPVGSCPSREPRGRTSYSVWGYSHFSSKEINWVVSPSLFWWSRD